MTKDMIERVRSEVKGNWYVPEMRQGVLWCDASHVTTGREEVEDVWLRKRRNYGHVNIVELDAALKGINLALNWCLQIVKP